MNNKLILVVYVPKNACEHIVEQAQDYFNSPTNEYITFVVPNSVNEFKIECLNPMFITNEKLVQKFEKDLSNINKNFEKILKRMTPCKRKKLIEKIKKDDK